MSTYRIEEDCLGQIKVEADKYWKSQTQRSLENFKIGQELMPASLIHSFAILKEACAKANLHFNKITEKQCEAIVEMNTQRKTFSIQTIRLTHPKVQMIRSRLRYISWSHKKSMLSYFHNWI